MRNNVVLLSLEEKGTDFKKNYKKKRKKKKTKQKQNQTYNCAVLDRRGKGCFMNS